jgi:hypothetical protein
MGDIGPSQYCSGRTQVQSVFFPLFPTQILRRGTTIQPARRIGTLFFRALSDFYHLSATTRPRSALVHGSLRRPARMEGKGNGVGRSHLPGVLTPYLLGPSRTTEGGEEPGNTLPKGLHDTFSFSHWSSGLTSRPSSIPHGLYERNAPGFGAFPFTTGPDLQNPGIDPFVRSLPSLRTVFREVEWAVGEAGPSSLVHPRSRNRHEGEPTHRSLYRTPPTLAGPGQVTPGDECEQLLGGEGGKHPRESEEEEPRESKVSHKILVACNFCRGERQIIFASQMGEIEVNRAQAEMQWGQTQVQKLC